MKVYLTTRFTPRVAIYDSTDTTPASVDWKKWIAPYIEVNDNSDSEITHVGEPVESLFPFVVAGLVGMMLMLIYLIRR